MCFIYSYGVHLWLYTTTWHILLLLLDLVNTPLWNKQNEHKYNEHYLSILVCSGNENSVSLGKPEVQAK